MKRTVLGQSSSGMSLMMTVVSRVDISLFICCARLQRDTCPAVEIIGEAFWVIEPSLRRPREQQPGTPGNALILYQDALPDWKL